MKARLVHAAIALAAVLAAASAVAVETPTVPVGSGGRLAIDKEEIDLGDVIRGETASATFVLRNTGEETLAILSAKPG
jgi:hypothetical protein